MSFSLKLVLVLCGVDSHPSTLNIRIGQMWHQSGRGTFKQAVLRGIGDARKRAASCFRAWWM